MSTEIARAMLGLGVGGYVFIVMHAVETPDKVKYLTVRARPPFGTATTQ